MLQSFLRVVVIAAAVASGDASRQLPEPIRTEKPIGDGSGGTLIVVAPDNLCSADLELKVTRTTQYGRQYVFQGVVAPPVCRWTVPDAPPGEYQGVLQRARGDQGVVAMSEVEVYAGSTSTTTIAPLAAQVEGLVSVAGIPVEAGTYVDVRQNGGAGWSWETRTDKDGYYRVAVQPNQQLCVGVKLPGAFIGIPSPCREVSRGVNRQDFDIPPGRIDLVLVPREGPIHDTPLYLSTSGGSLSVTVAGRVEGSIVGLSFGKHRLKVTTVDHAHTFDETEVILSPERPSVSVTLSVPYSR